jgi:AcrR family transcriptional regulator
MNAAAVRHTAEERREEILGAAVTRFGETGFHGTSTEKIAADVGVSQPYVFRLFSTKKALFIAAVDWAFRETQLAFGEAARGATDSQDAFKRMADAYWGLLQDQRYLGIQMQAYASCADPQIREVVQKAYGRLVDEVSSTTEASPARLSRFFADGTLLNVAATMGVLEAESGWAATIREGCLKGDEP